MIAVGKPLVTAVLDLFPAIYHLDFVVASAVSIPIYAKQFQIATAIILSSVAVISGGPAPNSISGSYRDEIRKPFGTVRNDLNIP
jgi:hypothetical protein